MNLISLRVFQSLLKYCHALFFLALFGCSPYSNSPINNGFHNLTAHYNAYFIANEKVKEIEASIYDAQKWNYDEVLPIHPQFDSTMSASMKPILDDIIQKSSIAIQRHPGSKWEDDSYLLVGKARYYGGEFADAIETYKYINTHSENNEIRHAALAELIRVYTDFEEYENAEVVVGYLEREELNKKNQCAFLLNTAYLHQQKKDEERTTKYLNQTGSFLLSDKARLHFLIAQSNHKAGNDSLAFYNYRQVLKYNPTYELEFYSKLYMTKATRLSNSNDLRKARNYFVSLLKDIKNEDYKDKIYFEFAEFELKNGHLEEAIVNYKESVRSSKDNDRQKGLSYLGLGKIYYDSIRNYRLAKSYYDSAVSTLPQTIENYESIKKRQEVLGEFVEHISIILRNDSLLHLATLPRDSLLSLARAKITLDRELKQKKKKKEKQIALNRARNLSKSGKRNDLITVDNENTEWYFDNSNAISRGSGEFQKKWGNRVLEDNWRRQNKSANATATVDQPVNVSESTEKEEFDLEKEVLSLTSDVPQTPEQKTALLKEIEVALYNLGKIYNLKLQESANAIERFRELISRFPDSEYVPEVYYQLYLLYAKSTSQADYYASKLKKDFPESIYAKLVDNPYYREDNFAANEYLKKEYNYLYGKYKKEEFYSTIYAVDSLLAIYPEYEFSDNMELLKVLCIGKTEEESKYQYELGLFIEKYPESDVNQYAKDLLVAVEEFQKERYNSSKAKYIKYFNQRHYFVIVSTIKNKNTDLISSEMKEFLERKNLGRLKTGNLILSKEENLFLTNWFPGKDTALKFMDLFENELDEINIPKDDLNYFVITEDNFNILYETKDSDDYLEFYKANY